MAPSKKKRSKAQSKNSLRDKQIDAFIESFDQEVKRRVEKLRADLKNVQENISTMFDREILRLPTALREMNWISYCALGEDPAVLEQLALEGTDVQEINEMASKALRTPVRTVRKAAKAKLPIESIEEEEEGPVLPLRKRSRQEDKAPIPLPPEQKPLTGKRSTRKPPTARKCRPPSSRLNQSRASKGKLTTPVSSNGRSAAITTPGFAPRFDSSIFKTPGLRAPASHEPVFSVSANGSPLAGSSDVFVTLPIGKGESIRVKASDLTEKDLLRLNPSALGSMKKLSAQVLRLCK
ncbi:borealin-like isoform X1 [Anolis carolinensis]|uniref:borealin-like isoform X1 n=1 Tax=Anolis carolinensis TaxID=28377 RepID=UPI002F2B4968